MSTEDLVIEAFKDLVKDELKTHIRAKVDEDPELKAVDQVGRGLLLPLQSTEHLR